MKIRLIRHGMTEANERRLYCGSTDLSLSDRGREELKALRYPAPGEARCITSGMRRCDETIAVLFGDVEREAIPGFREIDFGDFEMRSYEELKDDPAYQAWLTGDNERNVPPGGESGVQMKTRAMAALEAVIADGRDAVIVAHGGVIAALMAALFPGEERSRYEWQPRPGRGYELSLEPDGTRTYEELKEDLTAAHIRLTTIEALQALAESIVGKPDPIETTDRVVAVVEYRDGTVIDVIRQIKR
ncbi:MAG: histidine phosphatase family protein [Oscillospiraceae bacterium]|nr:histidine phosphatase family protein [Oscillospiraceae bacterium]